MLRQIPLDEPQDATASAVVKAQISGRTRKHRGDEEKEKQQVVVEGRGVLLQHKRLN